MGRPTGKLARSCVAVVAGLAVAGVARPSARAAEFEVQGDTALQGYEVVSPWGDVTVDRRRFMQSVGLAAYNLQGRYTPGEADYRAVVMLRVDADFGINSQLPANQAGGETNFAVAGGSRYIPGLQIAPLELMVGYVEGRNLAHGLLGFRVGRQYVTDALGWWAFDGGLVKVTTPYYLQVEAYGGLEERGGLPLSTSRFESQGVWRGSHTGFVAGGGTEAPSVVDYPSYVYAEPAPAYGVALESNGPSWVHGRFSYRHVYNTGTALTTQFPEPDGGGFHAVTGLRTSQERLGFAGDIGKSDIGVLKGSFVYDLYNQLVSSYVASAEVYAGKHVTVGADADYFVPTFDGDSIWNWFTHGPMTSLTGRVALRVSKRFNVTGSGGARLFRTYGDPTPVAGGLSAFGAGECAAVKATSPALNCALGQVWYDPAGAAHAYDTAEANRAAATTVDAIANLNGRYRFASGDVGLKGMVETGARGSREGADVNGEKRWDGGRYLTAARVSVYGWSDPTRPDRDAVSFGYVLTGGFKPAQLANIKLEWEHDTNRLVGQRYRVMALVNVRVLK